MFICLRTNNFVYKKSHPEDRMTSSQKTINILQSNT